MLPQIVGVGERLIQRFESLIESSGVQAFDSQFRDEMMNYTMEVAC